MKKIPTPISDSIMKKVVGFEEWVLENYNKYHGRNPKKVPSVKPK